MLEAANGAEIVVMSRRKSLLDDDKELMNSGNITVIQGDALVEEDVKNAYNMGPWDALVIGIGAAPKFTIKGMEMNPVNVCGRSMKVITDVMQPSDIKCGKIVIVSAQGVGDSYQYGPWLSKLFHSYVIKTALNDKLVFENITKDCAKKMNIPYVILRPAMLTSSSVSKPYRMALDLRTRSISRLDTGKAIVNCLDTSDHDNTSVIVGY
ncbi:hypothetical protein CANCADRAFT_2392 [Tortispora caseinolytica NRRL Y-17796]|uniref:NAD(P)-binding domain-containing protein n=1 Tax=Tortispora caseinolytica NRRL Y-17796 TaxID=767744 RepID=A0A1E4TFW0_9ASCO|nr:hypothetical protein CANCADRAFT_2392 [Tortispora caseinolytica NRRL Y-17796]